MLKRKLKFLFHLIIWSLLLFIIASSLSKSKKCEADEKIQEDFENEKIEESLINRANKIENCKITYYCAEPYKHICGNGKGITASGEKVKPYITCASDEIPFGASVMVDFDDDGAIDQYYVCEDRFGSCRKNQIDICVETHEEALQGGVQHATVYWLEE